MQDIDSTVVIQQEMKKLHATTCRLMTRFINGHHCPKLAQLIIEQLGLLLAHPGLIASSRTMYQQLKEHWQNVTDFYWNGNAFGDSNNTITELKLIHDTRAQ